jgi:hypothetical protein
MVKELQRHWGFPFFKVSNKFSFGVILVILSGYRLYPSRFDEFILSFRLRMEQAQEKEESHLFRYTL